MYFSTKSDRKKKFLLWFQNVYYLKIKESKLKSLLLTFSNAVKGVTFVVLS